MKELKPNKEIMIKSNISYANTKLVELKEIKKKIIDFEYRCISEDGKLIVYDAIEIKKLKMKAEELEKEFWNSYEQILKMINEKER